MSIFWSLPWPNKEYAAKQKEAIDSEDLEDFGVEYFFNPVHRANEPKWGEARMIKYKDEQIRVFPHEFSELTLENMKLYLEESHDLVPGTVAEEDIMDSMLRGAKRRTYEAALIDGCTEYEARLMAIGVDVTDGHYEIPAIGWYRIKPEYGQVYCYKREMRE